MLMISFKNLKTKSFRYCTKPYVMNFLTSYAVSYVVKKSVSLAVHPSASPAASAAATAMSLDEYHSSGAVPAKSTGFPPDEF